MTFYYIIIHFPQKLFQTFGLIKFRNNTYFFVDVVQIYIN